jgi:hypothetical protein
MSDFVMQFDGLTAGIIGDIMDHREDQNGLFYNAYPSVPVLAYCIYVVLLLSFVKPTGRCRIKTPFRV